MDTARLEEISRELIDLLDQQVKALVGRDFKKLTREELDAYEARKRRILKLRSELSSFLAIV